MRLGVDADRAFHLRAQPHFLIGGGKFDARFQCLQRSEDFLEVIAQAGHNAHAGHNDTSHEFLLSLGCENRVDMVLIIKNNAGSVNRALQFVPASVQTIFGIYTASGLNAA